MAGAEVGEDPDEGDDGVEEHGGSGVQTGDREGEDVEAEGDPVFALGGGAAMGVLAGEAEAALNGETQQHESGACGEKGRGVEDDGEAVAILLKHPGGEVGEKRGAEKKEEVAVEDATVYLLNAADEQMVIDPIDAGEGEGKDVDEEDRKDGVEAGGAVLMRNFELEHHNGDDDGEDAIGEGFEAAGGEADGMDDGRHGM